MAAPMDHNVHDRAEKRQYRNQLTETQLKRLKRQPRTHEQIHGTNHGGNDLADDHRTLRDIQLDCSDDAETDEEKKQKNEIHFGREDRNAEIAAEIFKEERCDRGEHDADERFGSGSLRVLVDNEQQEREEKIEKGV